MSPQLFLSFTLCLSLSRLDVSTAAPESQDKTDLAWYYGDDYHSKESSGGFSLEEFRTEYEYPSMPDYEALSEYLDIISSTNIKVHVLNLKVTKSMMTIEGLCV